MKELELVIVVAKDMGDKPYPDAKCQDCGDMGFFLDADNDPWPCVEGCPPKVYQFARYAQETYGVTVDIELLNRWAEEIKNERTDQFGNLRSDEPGKSNT